MKGKEIIGSRQRSLKLSVDEKGLQPSVQERGSMPERFIP